MKYYLTYDGDDYNLIGSNLLEATDAFDKAVEENDWCPALVDSEGVVLAAWDNSNYEWSELRVIGPQFDEEWYKDHEGIDRIAEEHDYKFGNWRL